MDLIDQNCNHQTNSKRSEKNFKSFEEDLLVGENKKISITQDQMEYNDEIKEEKKELNNSLKSIDIYISLERENQKRSKIKKKKPLRNSSTDNFNSDDNEILDTFLPKKQNDSDLIIPKKEDLSIQNLEDEKEKKLMIKNNSKLSSNFIRKNNNILEDERNKTINNNFKSEKENYNFAINQNQKIKKIKGKRKKNFKNEQSYSENEIEYDTENTINEKPSKSKKSISNKSESKDDKIQNKKKTKKTLRTKGNASHYTSDSGESVVSDDDVEENSTIQNNTKKYKKEGKITKDVRSKNTFNKKGKKYENLLKDYKDLLGNPKNYIFNFMKEQNMPYSVQNIVDSFKNIIKKKEVEKILEALYAEKKLIRKEYNQKIYLVSQNFFQNVSDKEMQDIDINLESSNYLIMKQEDLKTKLKSDLNIYNNDIDNDEIDKLLEKQRRLLLDSKIIFNNQVNEMIQKIPEEKMHQARRIYEKNLKAYNNIKKIALNIIEDLSNAIDFDSEIFMKSLSLESDEDGLKYLKMKIN